MWTTTRVPQISQEPPLFVQICTDPALRVDDYPRSPEPSLPPSGTIFVVEHVPAPDTPTSPSMDATDGAVGDAPAAATGMIAMLEQQHARRRLDFTPLPSAPAPAAAAAGDGAPARTATPPPAALRRVELSIDKGATYDEVVQRLAAEIGRCDAAASVLGAL